MKYAPYPSEICLFHICSLFMEASNNYYKITVHALNIFLEKGLIQKDIFSFDIQRKTRADGAHIHQNNTFSNYEQKSYILYLLLFQVVQICYARLHYNMQTILIAMDRDLDKILSTELICQWLTIVLILIWFLLRTFTEHTITLFYTSHIVIREY